MPTISRHIISVILMTASAAPVTATPPCKPVDLRLSVAERDGGANGTSHSGTILTIRNTGSDCTLASSPLVTMRDGRGRALQARAKVAPTNNSILHLGGGHSGEIPLCWISSPVFAYSRELRSAEVRVRFGKKHLSAPLDARMYGATGKAIEFEQGPLRVLEGMASDVP